MKERLENDTDLTKSVEDILERGVRNAKKSTLEYYIWELYQELMWLRKEHANAKRQISRLKRKHSKMEKQND